MFLLCPASLVLVVVLCSPDLKLLLGSLSPVPNGTKAGTMTRPSQRAGDVHRATQRKRCEAAINTRLHKLQHQTRPPRRDVAARKMRCGYVTHKCPLQGRDVYLNV